jgi:predicted transcriptional regulator of viral defense system
MYFCGKLESNKMNFWQLRNQFHDLACFNVHQVYAWQPDFEKNNLTRWTKQNLLVKLRNSWYSFPEYQKIPNIQYFVSNKIYSPSYISLHSALAFYGIIPEAVVHTTAVSSLKKVFFENTFGSFSYQKVLPELMFGYEQKLFLNKQCLIFATPEKAILDLLYLYPFYNNEQEIRELRFDEEFMQEDLNIERLNEFTEKFQSKTLKNRVNLLLKIYNLCSI